MKYLVLIIIGASLTACDLIGPSLKDIPCNVEAICKDNSRHIITEQCEIVPIVDDSGNKIACDGTERQLP